MIKYKFKKSKDTIINYTGRSKYTYLKNITLVCPKHGVQKVYELEENGKDRGIGCVECFRYLPIVKIKYDN